MYFINRLALLSSAILPLYFCIICPAKLEASVTPIAFQQFVKEYYTAKDTGNFSWSEIAYAIEKDYDEMALFCVENLPLGPLEQQGYVAYNSPSAKVCQLYCRCVIKNKLDLLRALCNKYPEINPDGSEYLLKYNMYGNQRLQERQILNIAIEERSNSLEWVKLLADFGADLNKSEDYCSENGTDTRSRTPIEAAIYTNKLDVVEFLLERKVDPNMGLGIAVNRQNKEAVILLLNFGGDPYYNNGEILQSAMRLGYFEIVDLLTAVYFRTKP